MKGFYLEEVNIAQFTGDNIDEIKGLGVSPWEASWGNPWVISLESYGEVDGVANLDPGHWVVVHRNSVQIHKVLPDCYSLPVEVFPNPITRKKTTYATASKRA